MEGARRATTPWVGRGPHMVPSAIVFLDALPVSGTNKLDRGALQQMTNRELPDGLADRRAGAR